MEHKIKTLRVEGGSVSTGGFLVDKENKIWLNVDKEAKAQGVGYRIEMKGKMVDFHVNEAGYVVGFKLAENQESSEKPIVPKYLDMEAKKQELIVRQSCLKAAVELVATQMVRDKGFTLDELTDLTEITAERLVNWVYR